MILTPELFRSKLTEAFLQSEYYIVASKRKSLVRTDYPPLLGFAELASRFSSVMNDNLKRRLVWLVRVKEGDHSCSGMEAMDNLYQVRSRLSALRTLRPDTYATVKNIGSVILADDEVFPATGEFDDAFGVVTNGPSYAGLSYGTAGHVEMYEVAPEMPTLDELIARYETLSISEFLRRF